MRYKTLFFNILMIQSNKSAQFSLYISKPIGTIHTHPLQKKPVDEKKMRNNTLKNKTKQMKRSKLLLLLPLLLLHISCSRNNDEYEALQLLIQARHLAYQGHYLQSLNLIDSLNNNYPYAHNQIAQSELLADSISKKRCRIVLDSIYNQQNEYKRKIYTTKSSVADKQSLQSKIDSLEKEKLPHRLTIQAIDAKEARWQASNQCVTSMRNRN